MKHIASRDNPDFRLLSRVLSGHRLPGERSDAPSRVGLEGVHLCQSWLAHVGQPELAFFDADRAANAELAELLAAVEPSRVRLCEPALLKSASQVVQGQGVMFVGVAPSPTVPARIRENCLWLDRVQDPGNLGTLLRTAAAAGIRHAYASKGCVAVWSPKVLRSGQGAHFVMTIHERQDLQCLRARLDVPLLATALENAVSLYEANLPEAAAWVFGNEGQGVDAEILQTADLRLRIPQNPDVESLNVAVAAGICLFEQKRRHAAGAE